MSIGAHRFSYLIANGVLPETRDIAHECANRGCVNPKHLSAETRKKNMANRKTRERMSTNSGNRGNQRLSDDQIRRIKEIYRDEDVADQEIVDRLKLSVGAPALARIRKGQTGKHIVVEGFEPQTRKGRAARGHRNQRSKLKPEQVHEIRRRRGAGENALALAEEFEISRKNVDDVVSRRTWKDLPEEKVSGTPTSPLS